MQDANADGNGSLSGAGSPQIDSAALIQALHSLTAAMLEMAASNMALVDSLTRQDEEEVDPHIPQGMGRKR